MRRHALLALLVLAGCGGDPPSAVVPADATTYVGLDASEAEWLMGATSRADVDFERDVEPWLGERAAYFARTDDEYGLVFDAEDEDAAEAFARKVTAGGPQRASAIIDGRLVLASTRDLLRAADAAADAGSLADSTGLDVTGEDGDDPPDVLLATGDPEAFTAGLEQLRVLPGELRLPPLGDGPLTARVWDRRIELDGLPPVDDVTPSLAGVTGAASFAFASADLGADLALVRDLAGIDLDLPALDAGTLVVQRGGVRVVAETSDEAALRKQAGKLDLQVSDGRVTLVIPPEPGGVAQDLGDTPRYREAERRLGGPPTLLAGTLAARRDGTTLIVSRPGG